MFVVQQCFRKFSSEQNFNDKKLPTGNIHERLVLCSLNIVATLRVASHINIFEMQQENNEMQEKLTEALRLIQLLKKQVEILNETVEIKKESTEMYKELLAYYVPNLEIETKWKRVYLPVYGKIKSPPFSKN